MSRSTLRFFPILATSAFLLFPSTSARAELIINAQNAEAFAGTTGNDLFVTLTNPMGSAPVTIGGFSFEVTASSPDVSFSQVVVGAPLGSAYIFDGNSAFGPDITLAGNGTQTISAADNVLIPDSGTTLIGGESLGLGIVNFDVLATAPPETIYLTFTDYPTTSFSDAGGNNVGFTVSDSADTIQIVTAAVPEPASLMMVGLMLCLASVGRMATLRLRSRCLTPLAISRSGDVSDDVRVQFLLAGANATG